MNKYLALVCCLASLVSARPDVSLGYHYNPNYNSGSSLLSAPLTSYSAAASGDSGISAGYDNGAASSGSVDFLSPGYNVGLIQAGTGGFSSSGSSGGYSSGNLISSGGLSGSGGLVGSGGLIGSGGLVGSGGLGYSSGNVRYGSGNLGLTGVNLGSVGVGGGFGLNQGYSGGSGSFGAVGGGQLVQQQQYAAQFQAPLITKSFYVHSAPEDHDDQQIVRYVSIGRPLKNYRVVFINAPSSTSTKAKIIAQVAPVEDKTAIYVLSKKSNDLDITADVVSPAPVAPSKPDVFFIKYKTPGEAVHAQHVIQAQYDQLGGTSSFSDEGVVPVQSVIGSLGESDASASANVHGSAQLGFSGISSGSVGGSSGVISSPVLVSNSGLSSGNLVATSTPVFVSSGGSSSGNFASSGGSSSGRSFGTNFVTTPVVISSGGSSSGLSSVSGLVTDQSQFDQVSGGKLQNYLPPNQYKKY